MRFGTLPRGARSQRVAARASVAGLSGGVQGLLQYPVAGDVVAPLRAGAARGQSPQVDAGDADAGHRPRRFQEKWRLALTLLRRARAAGLQLTAVLADAAYGDVTVFREALHRLDLPYAVGISSHLTVFRGTPRVAGDQLAQRPSSDPLARGVCRGPRDTRARVAPRSAGAGDLAPRATARGESQDPQILRYSFARHDGAHAAGLGRAPAMGDRAAVPAAEGRTRPRSRRGAQLSRLESARPAHSRGVYLLATGTATVGLHH